MNMSTLTMKDIAPFFAAYLAKYGTACTLSLDIMEEIMGTSDNEDAMLNDMHEAMTATDDDDRSPVTVDTSVGSPYSYAIKLDSAFEKDIETLANAAIENKRGGAVIMFDLFRIFGKETIENVWPVPGSENGKVGNNMPFDKQETSITKADGSTGKGTVSFYSEIVALSARGKALLDEKTTLKNATGDIKNFKPKISAIDTKISNFKSALVRAVNLAQRMAFVNTNTGMYCEIVMDVDDNGNSCVAPSNKLIFIKDKNNQTKFDVITIGQFLALKVVEGKTYSEIVGTVTRKPKAGTGPQTTEVTVNTLDQFDVVTAAYATFFDKIIEGVNKRDPKAYNALLTRLNAAGSDDLLISLNSIMNTIEGLLSKPGISKRLADLIADGGKETKAA